MVYAVDEAVVGACDAGGVDQASTPPLSRLRSLGGRNGRVYCWGGRDGFCSAGEAVQSRLTCVCFFWVFPSHRFRSTADSPACTVLLILLGYCVRFETTNGVAYDDIWRRLEQFEEHEKPSFEERNRKQGTSALSSSLPPFVLCRLPRLLRRNGN